MELMHHKDDYRRVVLQWHYLARLQIPRFVGWLGASDAYLFQLATDTGRDAELVERAWANRYAYDTSRKLPEF